MTKVLIERSLKEQERIKSLLKGGESLRVDGRLSYRYTDAFGKRKTIYAKSISELRKKERELDNQQKAGLVGGAETLTLNAMWDKYYGDGSKWKNSTAVNYKYLWETYIRDSFGKRKLNTILYTDVYDFYMYLHKERGLQVNTLESIHTLIHPTLTLAKKNLLISDNPASGMMAQIKKDTHWKKPKRPAVSNRDYTLFMETVANTPIFNKWYDFFIILFGTGCRIGEHIGITWEDVDFINHEINMNHQLVYREDKETGKFKFYISDLKKDASERIIPMTEEVEEAFKRIKDYQDVYGRPNLWLEYEGKIYKDFVFYNENNNFHHPGSVNRSITTICQWTNDRIERIAKDNNTEPVYIKNFSPHQARHTFASELCRNSNSLQDLQCIKAIMGHQSIETTLDIYAEVTNQEKANFLNKIKQTKSLNATV